jgi:serine protease Do
MSRIAILAVTIIMSTLAAAAEPNDLTPKDKLALAAKYAPSLVRVEYTLRYDQADSPRIYGWQRYCPVCGAMHSVAQGFELLREQRPLEMPGYLISDKVVATSDVSIESRFIDSIRVRLGGGVASAKPRAWTKTGKTLLLELDKPLDGAKALSFDKTKKASYLLSYDNLSGIWTTSVESPTAVVVRSGSDAAYRAIGNGLAVSHDGTAVGLSLDNEITVDDSWKGSPIDRPLVTADEMKKLEDRTQALADKTLLLAHLNFRSPKADKRPRRGMADEEGAAMTELFATAVAIEPNRVMILADLRPEATARLERIAVELPDGKSAVAKFSSTLKYYGAFVADLDKPLEGSAALSPADITTLRNRLLPTINLRVQGSQRTAHFCVRRFATFEQGWRGQLRPAISDSPETFFFDEAGRLVAIPLAMRQELDDSSRGSDMPLPVAAADIIGTLKDVANLDPANIPLSEDNENRLAWLGVELQPLDRDLARANGVSHLTNEGQMGALVSYVYPDSPAAAAGIETGAVLLRIRIPGRPLPVSINLMRDDYFTGSFPWDRLDEVPEQYFDEIPKPWPSADNTLNRTLTDIGFGKKFTLEYFQGGKELSRELTVAASPTYYDSAPRYKSEPLGLTVRDLTYEVRRYFQRSVDEPGVIVSKIEPGSRTSVAGIKPFEIITHVNDKPVMTAGDFEKLTKDQKELRLSVKRMLRGRVVKLSLDSGGSAVDANAPLILRPKD